MKMNKFLLLLCVIVSLFISLSVFGCGGGKESKVQDTKTIAELANEVRDKAKKQGLIVVDGLTVESPDKSIAVTFPEHYVILMQDGKNKGDQYVGIHVKHDTGITIIFNYPSDSGMIFNADDKVMQRKNEALKNKFNNSKEKATYQKINNKWFLVDNQNNEEITVFTTSSKRTDVMLIAANKASKLLKEELFNIAGRIKIQ